VEETTQIRLNTNHELKPLELCMRDDYCVSKSFSVQRFFSDMLNRLKVYLRRNRSSTKSLKAKVRVQAYPRNARSFVPDVSAPTGCSGTFSRSSVGK
jgi:hypothetical protein